MAQKQSKKQSKEVPEWAKGQQCEVYDHAKQQWVKGEVIDMFKDEDGDWIEVKYGRRRCQVPPNSSEIRDLQKKHLQLDVVDGWKVGNHCEWYNRSKQQWIDGEIVDLFSNDLGIWVRVRCGQHIYDILGDDVEHYLKPRDTSIMNVSGDDIRTMKQFATKYHVIAPTLHHIFGKSKQFLSDESIQSYILYLKCETL